MLGSDLITELATRGHVAVAPGRSVLDVTSPDSVARIATGEFEQLDWVFNCAAYTAVDKAESEPDIALTINGLGPGYLARACGMAGIPLVHLSTDFVFDGQKGAP